MKRLALLVELALLWLLPVAWMVFCFDTFRRADLSVHYKSSVVYLFLACIWLFSLKKLSASLPARRVRMWAGAVILCATALLTGLIVFRLYPAAWAFWFVFFPALVVLANTLPDKSAGNHDQVQKSTTPAAPFWLRAIGVGAIALVLAGASYFIIRWRSNRPGVLYEQAIALKHSGDFEQAAVHLEQSGSPDAQFNLAMLYQNGQGVGEDRAKALSLLQSAADGGSAAAQTVLGTKYAQGDGVAVDEAEAARWYEKAASRGYVWAQLLLGFAYESGQGVPQDLTQADKWFVVAAAAGDRNAMDERDFVETQLTDSQKAEATEQANSLAQRILEGGAS